MEKYENLSNAIIERAVDDYRSIAIKLNYLKNNKDKVMQKIHEHDVKLMKPVHYTADGLQQAYNRKVTAAKYELLDIENFFCSEWYRVLTKIDGKALLKMVKEDIKEKEGIDCDFL